MIDPRFVTTSFDLPGYETIATKGVVRGIIVRSRSVIGNFGASVQQFFGGNITILTNMCESARVDAYGQMVQHAAALGANAVLGVRYDATELLPGVSEVLCYGTAVLVQNRVVPVSAAGLPGLPPGHV